MLVLTGAKATLAASRPTLFLATRRDRVHQECFRFFNHWITNCGREEKVVGCAPERRLIRPMFGGLP